MLGTQLTTLSSRKVPYFRRNLGVVFQDFRLLPQKTLQAAFKPATHTDDPEVEYGYGWRITGETLWHSGETRGFRNVILRYPQRKLTVIVLSNRNDPEPYSTALAIAQLFLPGTARP